MPRQYISKSNRNTVKGRANNCCEYCKLLQAFSAGNFACEHIIPLKKGGTDDLDNLANSCHPCNWSKAIAISALDPITNQVVPLFHPRKDKWHDHFKWSNDFLTMIGQTPTGRATIIRLKTNRPELQNIRGVTIGKGHPPN